MVLGCASENDETKKNIQIQFVKTLGGSKNDNAQAITKTSDGGYAILGYTQSNDFDVVGKTNDSFDFWMLKYTANHQLQWQKAFGGSDDDRGTSIIQTQDGGFAIFGFSKSDDFDVAENAGAKDYWLLKLDTSGEILWQKNFGFIGDDNGTSLIETVDNGFLLIGVLDVTASGGEGISKQQNIKHAGGDYWAIKLDASGNKQWSNYYGGSFTDTPYSVVQTNDNGYLIVGSSDSDDVDIAGNIGSYDFWVVKISETGALLWEKSFGGTEIDEARAIIKTTDNNYVIVGDTRSNNGNVSFNNGAADLWVVKISDNGDLIWEKTFGGSSFDVGRSVFETQDGGLLISGSSRSADGDVDKNEGQNDAWLLKLDSNANLIWQKNIGGSDIDFLYDAAQLNDGSFVAVGESSSSNTDITENKGFTDLLIINLQ
ncbi:PKD protein [Tamlana nanhaiensis]|uniref:PKD protein n=2 Tax=Neotamlana nanhaiensis TaxID=1382798 RepID=A0A0D7W1E1_9FLAO|nr:PKD protein [Tamlana nanhaiensis]